MLLEFRSARSWIDATERVWVLAIIAKSEAEKWLAQFGKLE
jgi:hypothetical protein